MKNVKYKVMERTIAGGQNLEDAPWPKDQVSRNGDHGFVRKNKPQNFLVDN